MKQYTGKKLEIILNQIIEEQGVTREDIEYKVLSQTGFLIFSKVTIEAYTYKDCINDIEKYLTDVLSAMGITSEFVTSYKNRNYFINIKSSNNSVVIGFNGKNLYALESLVTQVINRKYHKRIKVMLDVNNYFKNKEERLKRTAFKIAAEVGKTKIDAKLDPMPNYDRKVIHKVLKEVHYVKTKSFGEGKNRHLIIQYDRENDLKYNKRSKEDL